MTMTTEQQPDAPVLAGVTRWPRRSRSDAVRVTLDNIVAVADWISDSGRHCDQYERHLVIDGGCQHAAIGDWVVRHDAPEPCFTVHPAGDPLIFPPDEYAAVRTVAEAAGMVGPSPDACRVPPAAPERSRGHAGASLAGCPTPCDAGCELNPDGCHQSHDPVHMRWHDPGWSCEMVQQAIAEAVSAEREHAEAAGAKLAAITARCEGKRLVMAGDILEIIGTGEETGHARRLLAQARAADAAYRLAAARAAVYEFLHQHGQLASARYAVALDLADTLRRIIDGTEEEGADHG